MSGYEVEDIEDARQWFEGLGKRILGPTRIGAHGTPIFFLHPKDMMGQLTEIMETPKADGALVELGEKEGGARHQPLSSPPRRRGSS